jgi:hypothetical protein
MNWEKIKPVLAYAYMILIILIAFALLIMLNPPSG